MRIFLGCERFFALAVMQATTICPDAGPDTLGGVADDGRARAQVGDPGALRGEAGELTVAHPGGVDRHDRQALRAVHGVAMSDEGGVVWDDHKAVERPRGRGERCGHERGPHGARGDEWHDDHASEPVDSRFGHKRGDEMARR